MKKIVTYLMLSVSFLLTACDKDDKILEPEIPVNYANIAGTWQLSEWNGEKFSEDCYCYLIIHRKADEESSERALEMYTNIDSDKSHYITSVYELEEDEDMRTIISGRYDHSAGFWNSSYLISELGSDRMVWTVLDDASDVSVYVRCESVPEDIIAGTRAIGRK